MHDRDHVVSGVVAGVISTLMMRYGPAQAELHVSVSCAL